VTAQPRLEVRCLDPRCGTLLGADAELCDECGGTALAPVSQSGALLLGQTDDREVAFGLYAGRANTIGRSAPESPPLDVDLRRLPGSDSVHRLHAQIDAQQGQWQIRHLGRNPVVVLRAEGAVVVQPGTAAPLRSGDGVQIGRIRLRFVVGTEG
jgi:hypothetical protein